MPSFAQILLLGILLPFSGVQSIGFSDLLPRSPKGGGHGGGHGSSHGSSGGGGGGKSHGASTGRGGSGDTGHSSIHIPGTSTSRSSNFFSGGGGKRVTLGSGSPFAGRQMGGGTRDQLAGSRRFGSGYPYYMWDPQYRGVYGNPFPFGFWPVYWPGYGYSEEYNYTVATERPGGDLSMVNLVASPIADWNVSAVNGVPETYWMVGDQQTVSAVLSLLVDINGTYPYACGVQNTTLSPFNASDPHLPFHIQNVIQWYRSSSYALAYTGYNNTYASAPLNESTTLDQSTPLPTEQVYSPFLHCINNTLMASLPILDGSPKLSVGDIVGIVIGSVAGAIIAGLIAFCVYKRIQKKRYEKVAKAETEMENAKDTKSSF